jgi:hypothetical protein
MAHFRPDGVFGAYCPYKVENEADGIIIYIFNRHLPPFNQRAGKSLSLLQGELTSLPREKLRGNSMLVADSKNGGIVAIPFPFGGMQPHHLFIGPGSFKEIKDSRCVIYLDSLYTHDPQYYLLTKMLMQGMCYCVTQGARCPCWEEFYHMFNL